MSIADWNKTIEYANNLCNELNEHGRNVRIRPYTMYDGRKGLYMQLFDCFNNFYNEYATGIWNTFDEMKRALERTAQMIRNVTV